MPESSGVGVVGVETGCRMSVEVVGDGIELTIAVVVRSRLELESSGVSVIRVEIGLTIAGVVRRHLGSVRFV